MGMYNGNHAEAWTESSTLDHVLELAKGYTKGGDLEGLRNRFIYDTKMIARVAQFPFSDSQWIKIKHIFKELRGGEVVYRDFKKLVTNKLSEKTRESIEALTETRYLIDNDSNSLVFMEEGGVIPVNICNFWAMIDKEIIDEYGDVSYEVIGGTKGGKTFSVVINGKDFHSERELWSILGVAAGSKAVVVVGMKKHLESAIKTVTPDNVPIIRRFYRTGWFEKTFIMPGLITSKQFDIQLETKTPYSVRPSVKSSDPEWNRSHEEYLDKLINFVGAKYAVPALCAMFYPQIAPLINHAFGRFATIITGESGSFKTTFAVMAMQMFTTQHIGEGSESTYGYSMWGTHGTTMNQLMSFISRSTDMPFLLDNYKPEMRPGSEGLKQVIMGSVEGDEKDRMNIQKGGKAKSNPIRSGLIVTGEDFSSMDMAVLGRSVVIQIPKDHIDDQIEKSSYLKSPKMRKAASGVAYEWLRWLVKNRKKIEAEMVDIIEITNPHKIWSDIARNNTDSTTANFERIASNAAALHLTYKVLITSPLKSVFEKYTDEFMEALHEMVSNITHESVMSDEGVMFAKAIRDLVDTGRAIIRDERSQLLIDDGVIPNAMDARRTIGYTHKGVVYLLWTDCKNAIIDAYGHDHMNLKMGKNQIGKKLQRNGYIDVTGNKPDRTKKLWKKSDGSMFTKTFLVTTKKFWQDG